jgi:hypothetical protein
MSTEQVQIAGEVRRVLPSLSTDGQLVTARLGHRGELITQSLFGGLLQALCSEGSLFVATNPTPGTGVAGIAATGAFSDAESLLHVRVNDASVKRHIPIALLLEVTAAGTNGTNLAFAIKGDTGATRYTSGGAALAPVNPNMRSANVPESTSYFGALVTAPATASARLISHGLLRSVIAVVGDKFLFTWGSAGAGLPAGMVMEGTAQAAIHRNVPAMELGATDQMVMSLFAASQTGAISFQYEYIFAER